MHGGVEGEGRGGELPNKKDECGCHTFKGILKLVLLPLRVFSLKRSPVGALTVPFWVSRREMFNVTGDKCVVLSPGPMELQVDAS